MVSVGYMIGKPEAPSGLGSFVNRRVIPPAIDAASAVESAAYELGDRVRAQPVTALLTAGALGLVIGAMIFGLSGRRRY